MNIEQNNSEQGIFINGKQQIIEMLQFMPEQEREKLLKNIKLRNAVMGRELAEKSLSFNSIVKLSNESLRAIFNQANPAIIGLALYTSSKSLQRKVLSSIDRDLAERAFSIMSEDLSNKAIECKRAQEKIIQKAILLSRNKKISL